ncbi:MAG: ABC-2 family transporter protein [Anaerolineales bacterium]|nr:ABC-2 family transporter protein [Anaerolineales bacterium]
MFWELSRRSFQRQVAYRSAAIAGLVTNFFFGLLRAAVLVALYAGREQVAGITVQAAVTFTGLTQAIIGFLSLFGWYDLMNTVYTGSVATDLLKPMRYYSFWLAQDAGRAAAQFLLRGIPLMLGYALVFDIVTPRGIAQWLAFTITLALAWLISFSWRFLANLSSFWVPNAAGIIRMVFVFCWFLSGFMMPLRFFPPWFSALANLTPFPHMMNTVNEVFLGVLQGPALLQALGFQLLWALALIAAGQVVLRMGVRRLEILGG